MSDAARGTQLEVERCDCNGLMRFRPTLSPWEFEGKCESCSSAVTRSWAHAGPAPVFVKDGEPRQGGLFS